MYGSFNPGYAYCIRLYLLQYATYMKKTYPDRVTLLEVPDAGHAMLAEQPEFIAEHMISYLTRHPIVLSKNTP